MSETITPLLAELPPVASLRNGPFARYMACEALSMTGTWMQMMAQGWVTASLTSSALMLSVVNLSSGLPMVLLSMKGGSVADRFDKRMILVITQVLQAVLAISAGYLILTKQIRIQHVVILAVIQGISNAFEMPAANALVPDLVSKEQMATAIAVDRSVFHATRLIGPAAAGVAIGLWGTASAFFTNAVSFIPLTLALFTLPPRPLGTAEEEEQRGAGMKAGIDYVRGDSPTLAMIGLISLTTFFVSPIMMVMMPLYARDILLLPPQGMGMLMSISAVGSLTGSTLLMRIPRDKRFPVIATAAVGAATALVGLSLAHGLWQGSAALVLLTVSLSTQIGLANTVVQERAPGPLRGRVSAIAGLAFFGLMPVASLLIASLSDAIGMRAALSCSATVFAIGASIVIAGPGRRALQNLPVTTP